MNRPIMMEEKRFYYFPKTFRWQGKRYEVVRVNRVWSSVRQQPKLFFNVEVEGKSLTLCQWIRTNEWFIA